MAKDHSKKNLFVCETFYSLMNILVIMFETPEKQIPSDILFTLASDFTQIIPKIKESRIFQNVFVMENPTRQIDYLFSLDPQEKHEVAKNPRAYFEDVGLPNSYTDLWVALDKMFSKFVYYMLTSDKKCPRIHIYEEGLGSYTQTFKIPRRDYIPHEAMYGNQSFMKNIADVNLYEPALYLGNNLGVTVQNLPRTGFAKKEFKEFLCDIFGSVKLSDERVVFFEECMSGDGRMVNDIELLYELESLVGRENIIIKRHPRNNLNRLSELGFHVMENPTIPWEMILLTNDISNKFFISIASSACFSPMITYGQQAKSILLRNMLIGRVPFLEMAEFQKLLNKIANYYNENEICIYQPINLEEFSEVIKYLGLKK